MKVCNKLKMSKELADKKIVEQEIAWLNGSKHRRQVHAYYCTFCFAWHTTTSPKPYLKVVK